MQRSSIRLIQPITRIKREQFDFCAIRKVRGFVKDEATVSDMSFHSHRKKPSSVSAAQQGAAADRSNCHALCLRKGQYLAFIYYYSKVNRQAPSEADMQAYFGVTPPSVHQMVMSLERQGLISRVPGKGRSIRLLVAKDLLPDLE